MMAMRRGHIAGVAVLLGELAGASSTDFLTAGRECRGDEGGTSR